MNKIQKFSLSAMMVLLLSACAAPNAPSYYSLSSNLNTQSLGAPAKTNAGYAISIISVQLPDMVDKPQIVVQKSDNPNQLVPLSSARWAGDLSDDIKQTLSLAFRYKLGVVNASTLNAKGIPEWAIALDIQRFDMVLDDQAALAVSWRVSPKNIPGAKQVLCQSMIEVKAKPGINGLVQAQQQALLKLVDEIATVLHSGQPAGANGVNTSCANAKN